MAEGPSIGIHVRRGDYASNPKATATHGLLPPSYYHYAIRDLRTKYPKARVFAFSDDPIWVEKHILKNLENAECVSHNVGTESFRDILLMSKCEGLVVANSSFSWWAGWLNDLPNKTIIAPKQWFADSGLDDSKIVPEDWLRR
jgi:hypothetical protein